MVKALVGLQYGALVNIKLFSALIKNKTHVRTVCPFYRRETSRHRQVGNSLQGTGAGQQSWDLGSLSPGPKLLPKLQGVVWDRARLLCIGWPGSPPCGRRPLLPSLLLNPRHSLRNKKRSTQYCYKTLLEKPFKGSGNSKSSNQKKAPPANSSANLDTVAPSLGLSIQAEKLSPT